MTLLILEGTADVLVPLVDEMLRFARGRLAKAAMPSAIASRQKHVEPFTSELAAYFAAMADRILGTVSKAQPDWNPDDVDWTAEDDELRTVLARWYTTLAGTAYAAVGEQLGIELRLDLNSRGIGRVMDRVATLVRGINEESRAQLRALVQTAIEHDSNADNLARGIRTLTDKWAGLDRGAFKELIADPDVEGWIKSYARAALSQSNSRAETIALTESANAFNLASTAGYADSGLVDEVEVFDGPECGWTEHDDPDLADGSTRTLDEADEYPIAHQNCQRAFGAVVAR